MLNVVYNSAKNRWEGNIVYKNDIIYWYFLPEEIMVEALKIGKRERVIIVCRL